VENPSESFSYNVVEKDEIIAVLYLEETGLGIEAIRTDGVFFTIVMEVSKDVKPGISPIKFESFGATADNDMNEMTPKLVEGKVEIIEASAPEATPTVQVAVRVLPVPDSRQQRQRQRQRKNRQLLQRQLSSRMKTYLRAVVQASMHRSLKDIRGSSLRTILQGRKRQLSLPNF